MIQVGFDHGDVLGDDKKKPRGSRNDPTLTRPRTNTAPPTQQGRAGRGEKSNREALKRQKQAERGRGGKLMKVRMNLWGTLMKHVAGQEMQPRCLSFQGGREDGTGRKSPGKWTGSYLPREKALLRAGVGAQSSSFRNSSLP